MESFDACKNSVNPAVLNEDVYLLDCVFCDSRLCERGLKSFLIADEKVELFSTDQVDRGLVELTDDRFRTDRCFCQIQDIACLQCGNVVGYHVSMPCRPCLESQNNGHFWMFYRHSIIPHQRVNSNGTATMIWGDFMHEKEDHLCEAWSECER
ncbi:protein FAM72A-like [Dreissena polymorpha]|uniref:Protein FAM72A n=1 Tax=Dreissena polymorpha TaxID=45954 RepID=A0A9D4MNY8_DREPO|nr:protein FAM72A-like [Dreissena polymorpha]KAH3881137.1 hypothetical protein DPMN_005060 [Dreissena polymorpha]